MSKTKKNKEYHRYIDFEVSANNKIAEKCKFVIGGIDITDFVTNIKIEVVSHDNLDGKGTQIFQKGQKRTWNRLFKTLKKYKVKTKVKRVFWQ